MTPPADLLAALDAIPREHIAAAIVRLAARAMAPVELTTPTAPAGKLLTPDEAAARLGVSRRWIYRHAKTLGAVRLSRRQLRVPEAGVERLLARKRGTG